MWRDKETIHPSFVKIWVTRQANSTEFALSQEMGQGRKKDEDDQKVVQEIRCFPPKWFQQMCKILVHLYVYDSTLVSAHFRKLQPLPSHASCPSCQQPQDVSPGNELCQQKGLWLQTIMNDVPNKSPQCTNSTCKFDSNFVLESWILISIFWEIRTQSIWVCIFNICSNSAKINHISHMENWMSPCIFVCCLS